MNIPNLISLFRLLLVPVVIWALIDGHYSYALLGFFIAGVSDLLDGFLARKMKCLTTLGKYLDPLADKDLLVAVFVTLGLQGILPSWLVILVVFRDFLILSGALLATLFKSSLEIKPLFISKANTLMQLMLVGILLIELSLKKLYPTINEFLFILTAATTLLSGGSYVKKWLENDSKDNQDQGTKPKDA